MQSDTPLEDLPESDDVLPEIKISGIVLDCETGEPFSNVTVKAEGNGEVLATTTTAVDGKYELIFQSLLTEFTVTASHQGHKPSSNTVNVYLDEDENNYTAQADLQLGKPKVLFLLGGLGGTTNISPVLLEAINSRQDIESHIVRKNDIPADLDFKDFDLIFIDALWPKTPDYDALKGRLQEAMAANVIVSTRIIYQIPLWQDVGNVDMQEHPWIPSYWTNINNVETSVTTHNAHNLIDYLAVKLLGMDSINPEGNPKAPVLLPKEGIYHPDADLYFADLDSYLNWYAQYNPEEPTVAICFGQSSYNNADTAVIDALIRAFEALKYNVLPYFYDHEGTAQGEPKIDKFLLKDGLPIVDLIIHYRAAGWNTVIPTEEAIDELEFLNVPVIKALSFSGTYEEWMESNMGLAQATFAYTISHMEIQGLFNPIVIGVNDQNEAGITIRVPIERQINWLVNCSQSLINLRYKDNLEKKVAIIYWSSPGKDKGAGASHLDVYASIVEILAALKMDGYDLGANDLPDLLSLIELMRNQGSNIGVWAPGELKKLVENYPVILVPEEEYLLWFNALNEVKRSEVIEMWGEPPGDIMMYEVDGKKYLVLPVIQFGNVIIGPEPSRGYDQDDQVLYHSGTVPPNHHYLAFYFWLKQGFDADAAIHLGKHGSVGWLPGKSSSGLDIENCWPAIVTQDIPVIYPFTVEGSESTIVKRRQNALIISHMIPPMTIAGLYGDLALLHMKMHEYDSTFDESVKEEYRKTLIEMVRELRLHEDLNIDLDGIDDFEAFMDDIHEYLHELESTFITNGLHVFGIAPEGERLLYLVQSLLGYDFREYMEQNNLYDETVKQLLEKLLINNNTPEEAQNSVMGYVDAELTNYLNLAIKYSQYIKQCNQEITSLLKALNGEYITPGAMGDPIINPEVLPTGKNLYSFDPRIMPTQEAWNVAVKLTDDLINRYLQETGEYPNKIAFMLWATHTIQDKGVMEAMIMYLMGVEPVRNPTTSYVEDVKLIENLGRPRIDVLVTTSALYLNDYKYTLDILNKAILLAVTADDDEYPNYVKENADAMYHALRELGFSEEDAAVLSKSRIFSPEPGNHRNAIEDAIANSHTWEDEGKLADTFIENFGHVYGFDGSSTLLSELYRLNLADSQVAMFRRYVNANDLFSSDSYAGYFGGLGLSIRNVSGNDPLMWIMNLENPNNPRIESLSESLARDVRTTYFNPRWIQAMQNHGPSGARRMFSFVENMFLWDVTSPSAVTNGMWDEAYSVYVMDKHNLGLKDWFNQSNPYALESMYAQFMETSRKDYWQTDVPTKSHLANEWAKSIIQNGVSCSHHTCSNLDMVEWAMQYMDANLASQFKEQMYKATENLMFAPGGIDPGVTPGTPGTTPGTPGETPAGGSNQVSSSGHSHEVSAEAAQESAESAEAGEEGAKSYEVSTADSPSSSQDNSLIYTLIGIISILALVGAGFYFGPGRRS